jgi:hypothetical protein
MYCQHCGNEIEKAPDAIAEAVSADVEIARINAERDVAVERIRARQANAELETAETIAEVEAGAEIASAEVIGEIIAAETQATEEPEPEPEPLIITEPPADDGLDLAPPETAHRSEPKTGGGWSFT